MHLSSVVVAPAALVAPKEPVADVNQTSCCQPTSKASPWLKIIDRICRVAIGIFAAWIAPMHFGVSLGLGIIVGGGYAFSCSWLKKPLFPAGESKPVCAQGYMDFLSGMRFPSEIGTVATATFIGAHMRHDPQFYVPFCGLFLGLWIGREAVGIVKDLGGRLISAIALPPSQQKPVSSTGCCC